MHPLGNRFTTEYDAAGQPFPVPQIALVKGDPRSASIASASIVTNVTRDRMMEEYHAL